ncbi:hypothetical protein POTOM_000700 [Populus tomentosa]|uniref:RING-type E3 ubiquitin transferase n=1 Tax=Populus tomentosa TaxID=118781 RepID=A0A8X8IUE9_POPTO|nr:hypothetical protein POTOM_000700 [Populus tomentosa]
MGLPQAPAPPHLYPQQLQLKLYQAFIFSIPILFSIILFLLFYLFYLKRRASSISSPPHIIPGSSNQATPYHASSVRPLSISLSHAPNACRKENKKKASKEEHFFLLCCAFGIELYAMICQIVLKEEFKDKLPIVLFDEELMTKDSQCCVCLGEFEIEEEVLQIPSCKHVFHIDCIHHWLHSNSTCPLCRCYVIFPTTKFCTSPLQSSGPMILPQSRANSHHPQNMTSEPRQQEDVGVGSTEQFVIPMEGPASATTQLRDSSSLPEVSISMESGRGSTNGESVILHIRTHSPRSENLPLHEVEIGR